MLIFTEFPITDIRQFVVDSLPKMSSPFWPAPIPYREFMREAGAVRLRGRGGIAGWMGENEICDVHRGVVFTDSTDINCGKIKPLIRLKNLSSFFYSDGLALGKYEFVFKSVPNNINWKPQTISDLLCRFGNSDVKVKIRGSHNAVPFFSMGNLLSQHYFAATTFTKDYMLSNDVRVFDEMPVLFLELGKDEQLQVSNKARQVPLSEQYGILLCHWWLECSGSYWPVWSLQYNLNNQAVDLQYRKQCSRTLRLYIMRLHAEYHVLRRVLRCIEDGSIHLTENTREHDKLQRYLNDATRRISNVNRKTGEKYLTNAIEEIAYTSLDIVNPGQRDALLDKLSRIRPTVLRKVQGFINNFTHNEKVVNMSNKIEINVTDQGKLEFTGDLMIADQITKIHGEANSIGNQQLKTLIQDLTVAVGEMSGQLAQDKQEEVAKDLEMLVTEAQKEKPSERHWTFSIEGLKQAAKDVGEIGKPVLELAAKIAAILVVVSTR